jgi:hypothetical protein
VSPPLFGLAREAGFKAPEHRVCAPRRHDASFPFVRPSARRLAAVIVDPSAAQRHPQPGVAHALRNTPAPPPPTSHPQSRLAAAAAAGMPYVTADGRVVEGKPGASGVVGKVTAFLWAVVNLVWLFLTSLMACGGGKGASGRATSSSGGAVRSRPAGTASGGGGASGGAPRPPANPNIRSVANFKPGPCGPSGG